MAKPDQPVEAVYGEISDIVEFLNKQQQPSLSTDLDKSARKVLLLSAASYFEHQVTELLRAYAVQAANDSKMATFLYNQALKAKYHTLFDWGKQNEETQPSKSAAKFFGLFGEQFKKECADELKGDANAQRAMEAFLEIGHLRNILVHNNFAAYASSKTTGEIFSLYNDARGFIEYLRGKLIVIKEDDTKDTSIPS